LRPDLKETDHMDREDFMEIWETLRDSGEKCYTWLGPTDGDPILTKFDYCLLRKQDTVRPVYIERFGEYSIQKYEG